MIPSNSVTTAQVTGESNARDGGLTSTRAEIQAAVARILDEGYATVIHGVEDASQLYVQRLQIQPPVIYPGPHQDHHHLCRPPSLGRIG